MDGHLRRVRTPLSVPSKLCHIKHAPWLVLIQADSFKHQVCAPCREVENYSYLVKKYCLAEAGLDPQGQYLLETVRALSPLNDAQVCFLSVALILYDGVLFFGIRAHTRFLSLVYQKLSLMSQQCPHRTAQAWATRALYAGGGTAV